MTEASQPQSVTSPPGEVSPDLADQVFESLVRLFWGARQHSESLKREYGVTAAQLSALRVLERHGELTHRELAELLFLRASTLSGIVDRLQRQALLARERSQTDRRLVRVKLAPAGHELLTSIPHGQSKFGKLRALVRELPRAEAEAFHLTLDKLVGLLSREGLLDESAPVADDAPGESL